MGLIFSHLFKIKLLIPGVKSEKSTSRFYPVGMDGIGDFFSDLVLNRVAMLIPALLKALNHFLKKIRFEFIEISY